MESFSLVQLEKWVRNCRWAGKGQGDVISVEIDSRKVVSGSLFVALPGEKTDGHRFIDTAFEKGALLAVVSENWAEQRNLQDYPDRTFLVADSPLRILQEIAEGYLGQFPSLVRLALTGSNGKTTTKEIAGSILSCAGKALFTEGNFNSDIGLPLTVFRVEKDHQWALFEMGMNRKGEIAELAAIVRPHYALITNVGTAHVGMLGSRDALAREKKDIFSFFDGNQTALVYEEDAYKEYLLEGVPGRKECFGPKSCKDYLGAESLGLKGYRLRFTQGEMHLKLWGRHNLLNCLAALALVQDLGIRWEDCRRGVEACEPIFGRMEVMEGPVTLVRDCYNANPESMLQSMEALEELDVSGRKVLVLADMGELGQENESGHRKVWEKARTLNCYRIFTLGKTFYDLVSKDQGPFDAFVEHKELEEALKRVLEPGDLIWLKGSRTMALERLTEPLMNL